VALLVEMIADRRMDRGEFLRTSHSAEARHGTFSSSKRLVRILRPMVQAATGFLLFRVANVLHGRVIGPKGAVRRMRTSLRMDSDAVPYDAPSWRHSARAAVRLNLKLTRE